jgi:hypothetical protein
LRLDVIVSVLPCGSFIAYSSSGFAKAISDVVKYALKRKSNHTNYLTLSASQFFASEFRILRYLLNLIINFA